ncbi:MAG: type II secretion system F family protein [Planctomycetaceae bacterium]|nr:type II secretion system F family protein [Planctomycetaceae bacterium]
MTMPDFPVEPGGGSMASKPVVPARAVGRSLSVDDFVVLNDEIRAFIRARIPLDVGLRGTASHSEGLLRDVANRIADRTARGVALTEAVAEEGTAVPAEYRALLLAGLRTGRLAEVLESISEVGESISGLRRQLRLSMVYPAIVLMLAYGLFLGLLIYVVPTLHRTQEMFRMQESTFLRLLISASETVGIWGIGLPLALIALWIVVRLYGVMLGRPSSLDGLRWLPGAREVGVSRFAHVLAVLVQHGLPFPDAVRLSGDASGSTKLQSAAGAIAKDVESGASLDDALAGVRSIPAFLKWLMVFGAQQGSLADSLRQAAAVYEQRALVRLDRFRRLVPPVIVLVFGGLITLIYALSVFVPMTDLLQSLEGVPR